MNREKTILAAVAAIVLLGLYAWQYEWFKREPAALAQIKSLVAAPPSPDNRDAVRDAMRRQTEGMSPEQRMQFFDQMAPVFVPLMAKRFEQEFDRFMSLSPDERTAELDKRIDDMRKRGGPGGGGPSGGPGAGGPPRITPQQAEAFQKKMLDYTTPDQRAKFEQGIQMFNDRLKQRGLNPVGGPGGGFF